MSVTDRQTDGHWPMASTVLTHVVKMRQNSVDVYCTEYCRSQNLFSCMLCSLTLIS